MKIKKIELGLTAETIEPLAKAIRRLEQEGRLTDRKTQIRQELARAANITSQNGDELVKAAATRPITKGVRFITSAVKLGLRTYIDDLRLQLMLNQERRTQRRLVTRRLNEERKDIQRIERDNRRYHRQQARVLARAHKQGQREYKELTPDIDEYLQSRDNERIAWLNRAYRFLEESEIRLPGPYGHTERQRMYDAMIPEVDVFLQQKDNARIRQANRIHSIMEEAKRKPRHNEKQRTYDGLKPDVDTYLQGRDNERIAWLNKVLRFTEENTQLARHKKRQKRYNRLTPDVDIYLQTRDNERIAWQNKVRQFLDESTRLAAHEKQQREYDEMIPQVDVFLQEKDNARIAAENTRFKENSTLQKDAEAYEVQKYFDSIAENIDAMEAQVTARDNLRIAKANEEFIREGEDLQMAAHAVKQDEYDEFGNLIDGWHSPKKA